LFLAEVKAYLASINLLVSLATIIMVLRKHKHNPLILLMHTASADLLP